MPQPPENPFPIVGLGASAGGLGALTQLLAALPPHPGLALVVIQHLDPRQQSRLTELLRPHTEMSVTDAVHGAKVLPDHVYVIQPNTSVALADGVLSVTPRPDEKRPHYPVDHFLRSLAAVQGPHAVGVILSGTGSDGTLGICEIKAAGGVTFAQDDVSAQHKGMPQSAVASGAIDLVLSPADIAARLTALPQHPYLEASAASVQQDGGDDFQRVIAALRKSSGVDFSQYRDTTIKRRAARRMLLRGFKRSQDYARCLEEDSSEAEALYRDVLINVTSFFRDPEVFEEFKEQVCPALIAGKTDGQPIRVWVPGCSTGQEAYSIAMVLLECLDEAVVKPSVQLFATDLGDPAALDKARAGVYPESIEAEVSPARLRRFFTREEHGYRIQKSVRDLCVFARQNLTVDPPFSRVDLVTCRNVMIYMSPILQERILPVFHFALNPGGFLVLGMAETIGPFGDLFDVVNREQKIYRKKESTTRPQLSFMADDWLLGAPSRRVDRAAQAPLDLQREADRIALSRYAPPSVLLNQKLDIQQFRGRTAPYLETPTGQPTTNILRLAKEGLFMELQSALTEIRTTRLPVVREHLRVRDGGADIEFTLRILPVNAPQSAEFCLLVLFESKDWPAWSAASAGLEELHAANGGRDAAWLRQELTATKQYLQSIVDQQDAASQELRAAHEEVLSSNEELQSTNEELETTKEELQSANEELTTVNEQFQDRNAELDALTDDLSNFITSAHLPMVTVGRDLRIRRLTPASQQAFNLLPTDVGRSIEHIKFSIEIDGIAKIIEQVISSGVPWERDVTDREGRWWVLRVLPFLTADKRIDRATIVAVDIDLIKRSLEVVEARDYALAVVEAVQEPLVVLDSECRVGLANDAFYALFGVTREYLVGRQLWDASPNWVSPVLQKAMLKACAGDAPMVNVELQRILPGRGQRTLVLNARHIVRRERPGFLLLAIEDVTDTRQAESLRVDAETLRLIDKRKDEFLGILAHELRNPLGPMRFALEIMQHADGNSAETTKARQVLDRQVTHMVRIVDDLLDVSRITQGKVELRQEALTLSSIVTSAVELCRPAIAASRHTLTVSLPEEPVTIQGDAVRLTQVFVNLLNNAVKFTLAGGHIWIIAEVIDGDTGAKPAVRVRVRDTGIGIAADVLPNIFEMFVQGDRSLERTRTGLGVGLTLVRNLVALHGGTVEVRSDGVGTGAEFIVCFPIQMRPVDPAMTVRTTAPTTRAQPLRVLVADDNPDARDMLSAFLRREGHTVAVAENGADAVALEQTFRPDLAILDIGMPALSGYDAAEELRRRRDASSLTLVALSGLGQDEDKARALRAGFDRHFTKPVDVGALREFLAGVKPA